MFCITDHFLFLSAYKSYTYLSMLCRRLWVSGEKKQKMNSAFTFYVCTHKAVQTNWKIGCVNWVSFGIHHTIPSYWVQPTKRLTSFDCEYNISVSVNSKAAPSLCTHIYDTISSLEFVRLLHIICCHRPSLLSMTQLSQQTERTSKRMCCWVFFSSIFFFAIYEAKYTLLVKLKP